MMIDKLLLSPRYVYVIACGNGLSSIADADSIDEVSGLMAKGSNISNMEKDLFLCRVDANTALDPHSASLESKSKEKSTFKILYIATS